MEHCANDLLLRPIPQYVQSAPVSRPSPVETNQPIRLFITPSGVQAVPDYTKGVTLDADED